MCKIGVLVSGRGTNLQALLDAQNEGNLGGEVVLVVSNRSGAKGLERARAAGIKTEVLTRLHYPDKDEYDAKLIEVLIENNIDLVVLAGFMRILTERFILAFENKIINIHPSLLPAFKGVRAQWQAVDYGVKISGCTTHFVDRDIDAGPIIMQRAVPVASDDDGDSLAERILEHEHEILVESVRLFCENRLEIRGRKVIIKE